MRKRTILFLKLRPKDAKYADLSTLKYRKCIVIVSKKKRIGPSQPEREFGETAFCIQLSVFRRSYSLWSSEYYILRVGK